MSERNPLRMILSAGMAICLVNPPHRICYDVPDTVWTGVRDRRA